MLHAEITETIIGCSFKVHRVLGFGFAEIVYERALMIELARAGLNFEHKEPITVYYDGEVVGDFEADLLVEDNVIVELKSVENMVKAFEVQTVNYLTATGIDIGLLINFGPKGVDVKRKYRERRQDQQD